MTEILDYLCGKMYWISLISIPFLLFFWGKTVLYARNSPKPKNIRDVFGLIPKKSTALFIGPILFTIIFTQILIFQARTQTSQFLNSMSPEYKVEVNGKELRDKKGFTDTVQNLYSTIGHHSHPTESLFIDVTDKKGHLKLLAAKDSDQPDEYWIFYPSFETLKRNEIGRIRTHLFDSYSTN